MSVIEFNSASPVNNVPGAASKPLFSTRRVIASLNGPRTMDLDSASNRIQLEATVGWLATSGTPTVEFSILRDDPNTGTVIYATDETGESGFDRFKVTTLEHVDLPQETGPVLYYLEARVLGGGTATVIGPVTFSGAEITPNP